MPRPNGVSITVRYLGVVRLISGRREDVLGFAEKPSVEEVLLKLGELLPQAAYEQIARQTLLLAPEPQAPGLILEMPKDGTKRMENGSCLTVVTPVTGG